MNWPKVNPRELFEEIEKRFGITRETNDIRPSSLGAHPSESFYSQSEPEIDIVRMRTKFDKVANRY